MEWVADPTSLGAAIAHQRSRTGAYTVVAWIDVSPSGYLLDWGENRGDPLGPFETLDAAKVAAELII